jgi:hypothetical protein
MNKTTAGALSYLDDETGQIPQVVALKCVARGGIVRDLFVCYH